MTVADRGDVGGAPVVGGSVDRGRYRLGAALVADGVVSVTPDEDVGSPVADQGVVALATSQGVLTSDVLGLVLVRLRAVPNEGVVAVAAGHVLVRVQHAVAVAYRPILGAALIAGDLLLDD